MEFPVKAGAPARHKTECAILPVFDDGQWKALVSGYKKQIAGDAAFITSTMETSTSAVP